MSEEISVKEFIEAWKEFEVRENKRAFTAHLSSYIIINAFLVFVNLWTNPENIWFIWVLGGWGIGLAFHFVFSRPSQVIGRVDEEAARILYFAKSRAKSGK